MKRWFTVVFVLFSCSAFSQYQDDYSIPDQFIVMLKPGHEFKNLLVELSGVQNPLCLSKRMNIWLLERNTKDGADNFLEGLRSNSHIKLAQFNHRIEQRSIAPDDTLFFRQWGLHNTGQGGGTTGDDIDAENAWGVSNRNVTANGDTLVVAIVDVSFDYTHPDLNFFVNRNEIPGNGVDDDGNGYVDDYYGWNALHNSGNINSGGTDDHSMHCAGVAGAIANNVGGIAGVCWGTKILRVGGATSAESQVVAAYAYIIEMRALYNATQGAKGAFVVSENSSFGVGNFGALPSNYPIWCSMYDTMGYYGILSSTAAPDWGVNVDVSNDVPTGCPSKYMISVTNTTSKDRLYTNAAGYGHISIDLGAPGTSIYSTFSSNTYGYLTGTSMSAPHVAGAVAEMLSAACPKMIDDYMAFPDSISLIIKQMMLDGTTRLSDLYNQTVSGGRLNLYHAVLNLNEYNCSNCTDVVSLSYTQPTCHDSCNGTAKVTATGTGGYICKWSTGDSGVASLKNLCPGFYSVTVTDSNGCSQIRNCSLFQPDSIAVSSIDTRSVVSGDMGNIIVSANAGNYGLQYSIDSVHYQSGSTLIINSNGTYNVYIKSETGCVVEKTVSVLAGNDDLHFEQGISVFPVPVIDALNISLNLPKLSDLRVSIFNMLGELVMDENKMAPSGVHTATVDVSALANGFYLLRISSGAEMATRKFTIVRK